jgi:hypothetical protein
MFPYLERLAPLVAGRASLDVVVAYDGIAAAQQAVDVIAALKSHFPAGDVVLRVSSWWFRFLQDAAQLTKATAAATEADVLVVAANRGTELPASVNAWLDKSLAKNRKFDVAVVALVGPDQSRSARFRTMQRTARAAGALFLTPPPRRPYRRRPAAEEKPSTAGLSLFLPAESSALGG